MASHKVVGCMDILGVHTHSTVLISCDPYMTPVAPEVEVQ